MSPKAAEPAGLEQQLTSRGVSPKVAAELCSTHPAEFISERLEVFDWLISRKDKRVSKSPAGYLSESIRKGYSPPKGFESKADREKREAEVQKRARDAQEAKRRAEEEEAAKETELKARIEGFLNSLSPEERKRCEEEALEAAPTFYHHQLRRNRNNEQLTALYMGQIIGAHVTKLLEDRDG